MFPLTEYNASRHFRSHCKDLILFLLIQPEGRFFDLRSSSGRWLCACLQQVRVQSEFKENSTVHFRMQFFRFYSVFILKNRKKKCSFFTWTSHGEKEKYNCLSCKKGVYNYSLAPSFEIKVHKKLVLYSNHPLRIFIRIIYVGLWT